MTLLSSQQRKGPFSESLVMMCILPERRRKNIQKLEYLNFFSKSFTSPKPLRGKTMNFPWIIYTASTPLPPGRRMTGEGSEG